MEGCVWRGVCGGVCVDGMYEWVSRGDLYHSVEDVCMCEGEGEACNNLHHSAERNLSISFTTKGERNSGFAGECGERERGRSECKAFL